MSLSICLLTADPAGRIAAILEPLRPYAEEILIAADSRVDEGTLGGYAAVADRVVKLEFSMVERHLGWLYRQCRGDWVLRLDGDEVPSHAFVRRLPEMLATRRVRQYWVSVEWLYPDGRHVLAEAPWSCDFPVRLMRNDGALRAPGILHAHVVPEHPHEYADEPFYHLGLLTNDVRARRDKAVVYEVARPHLLAPGGGRINEAFYLPELREPAPRLRPVPQEDEGPIVRALGAGDAPRSVKAEAVELVTLQECDRMWAARSISESAYRATIEPREEVSSLLAAERRDLFFYVTNEGTERWPDRLEDEPAIRLSYHWLDGDGNLVVAEGGRTAFPHPVDPGRGVLVPLCVNAPATPGEYVLEVDVVHELVRWFGCGCKVALRVAKPERSDAAEARLAETPAPHWRRWRRLRIPRVVHRVWLGNSPMPDDQRRFGESFAEHNPGWRMQLWSDQDLRELGISTRERERSRTHSELSNLARYEILSRYGGVYVDTDVECRRSLAPLLRGVTAFAALEQPGRAGSAVLGSIPGHPAFERAARIARRTLGLGAHSADANGPYMLSLVLEEEPGVTIFGAELFYPYGWEEPGSRNGSYPDAYAVHHWAKSWWLEEQARSGSW